jgi:hypothetical protein
MWEYEDITEEMGKEFAKEIGAIHYRTSAKNGTGIDVRQ